MFIRSEVPQFYFTTNRDMAATFEHIVPRSAGGYYTLQNGACVCERCNNLRGNMPLEVFFDQYEELLQHRREKPARDAAEKKMIAKRMVT